MRDDDILIGTLVDDAGLTLEELARVCAVSDDWVAHRVAEGIIVAAAAQGGERRFASREVWRVRRLRDIERDFDAAPELAALVTDLLDEIEALRARLRRAGLA